MSRDIYGVSLKDIMPKSLLDDPYVQAIAEAIDPELQAVSGEIILCVLLARIDVLPEEVLDLLAWQFHVDFYEADLPVEQKRSLVRQSISWHRHKGTPWAVEQVVSVIFQDAVVSEWFDYGGEPYYFRVEVGQTFTADIDLGRLVRLINATKNTRSWLENITVKRTIDMGLKFAGILSEGNITEIGPIEYEMQDLNSNRYYGGIIYCQDTITINAG